MRKWLVLLGALLLLSVIFLPQIASTPMGKPFFVRQLERKTQANVEVASLKLSWFGPQIFQNVKFKRDAVTGSFDELQIKAPFWSFTGPFSLINGQIAYQGGRVENVEGSIIGNDFSLTGVTLQGYVALKGQIYSQLHFYIQIDVQKFPVVVIDQTLDQLLGPTIDLYGTISMDYGKGSLDLKVESNNLKTHIQGNLSQNGFTLNQPLLASIQLTPQVSTILLKDANPLFVTGLSAKSPITLKIDSDDFFFPFPYSVDALNVGKATLDLGLVRCKNGTSLSKIMALLKAEKLSALEEMNVWFTPVSFSIRQGILKAGRLDALIADSIHICTWGDINLVKDRLDMILGIPASTLKQSVGIKNLPENYVLKIELRGSTLSPDINKGAAGAKIAALLATDQIPQKGIWGAVKDIFSKKNDSDVPPPNRPFPWEK